MLCSLHACSQSFIMGNSEVASSNSTYLKCYSDGVTSFCLLRNLPCLRYKVGTGFWDYLTLHLSSSFSLPRSSFSFCSFCSIYSLFNTRHARTFMRFGDCSFPHSKSRRQLARQPQKRTKQNDHDDQQGFFFVFSTKHSSGHIPSLLFRIFRVYGRILIWLRYRHSR